MHTRSLSASVTHGVSSCLKIVLAVLSVRTAKMSDDLRSTALLAALMGGVLVTRLLKGYLDDYLTERRAKQLYADKREEVEKARRAAYERVQRYSDDELTQKDARELLDALKRGETSAVRTVRAFLSKVENVT